MSLEDLISDIQVKASEIDILMKELRKQLVFKNFNKFDTPVLEYSNGNIFLTWRSYDMPIKYAKKLMKNIGSISQEDFNQWYYL